MTHQLYITHCTRGTSVFRTADDNKPELSAKPLGYSVRSTSATADLTKKIYSSLAGVTYYHLPTDATLESHTVDNSPIRFFYLPSIAGQPTVGCVQFRPKNTVEESDSYFAHIVYGEVTKPWTAKSVLQTFGSAFWRQTDGEDISDSLPTVDFPASIDVTKDPLISEQRFEAFIKGNLDWKINVCGEQKSVTPELFENFLTGVLSVWKDSSKKIILVADSATAALFFYGILKLAPGGWGTYAAFSTYESSPMDFSGRLCATTFDDPMKNDLPTEMYDKYFVYNVFTGRHTQFPPSSEKVIIPAVTGIQSKYPLNANGTCSYAKTILCRLKTESWAGVTGVQQISVAMNVKPSVNPDTIVAGDFALAYNVGLTKRVLTQQKPNDIQLLQQAFVYDGEPIWRRSDSTADMLQKQLSASLIQLNITDENIEQAFKPILGTKAHLLILELLGTQATDEKVNRVILYLLKNLPTTMVSQWLIWGRASESAKLTMLLKHISNDGQLPPDTEELIFDNEYTALVAKLLVKLDASRLGALWNRYVTKYRIPFIVALTQSVAYHGGDVAFLNNRIAKISMQDLLDLYKAESDRYYADYPNYSTAMGKKLDELATKFESVVPQFKIYLETLSAGSHLMSEQMSQRVEQWNAFKAAAKSILDIQDEPSTRVEALDEQLKKMVLAFEVAAPEHETMERAPLKRKQLIQNILAALFPSDEGFKQVLPPISSRNEKFWEKVIAYFEDGTWAKNKTTLGSFVERMTQRGGSAVPEKMGKVTPPPKSMESKSGFKLNKKQTMYLSIGLGTVLVVTALFLVNLDTFTGGKSADKKMNKPNPANSQTVVQKEDKSNQNQPVTESEPKQDNEKKETPVAIQQETVTEDKTDTDSSSENTPPKAIVWDDAPEYGDKYETKEEKSDVEEAADSILSGLKEAPNVMAKLSELPPKSDLEISDIFNTLKEPTALTKGRAYRFPTQKFQVSFDENGSLDLVQNGFVDSVNMNNLKLGPGLFVFQNKVIRWGVGDTFDPQNPVTQYRLSDLEKALDLEECYISLIPEQTTVKLQLTYKAAKLKVSKDDRKQNEQKLEQRQLELKELSRRLREYNRDDMPQNAKAKILHEIGVMISTPIGDVAPIEPQKKDFAKDDEYQAAMEDYRRGTDAYNRQRELVVKTATETEGKLQKEIERLSNLEQVQQAQADDVAKKNISQLFSFLKLSAFVLYRPDDFQGEMSLTPGDDPFAGTMTEQNPNPGAENSETNNPTEENPTEDNSDQPLTEEEQIDKDFGSQDEAEKDGQEPQPLTEEEQIDKDFGALEDEPEEPPVDNPAEAVPADNSVDDGVEVIDDPFREPSEKEKSEAVRIVPRSIQNTPLSKPNSEKNDSVTQPQKKVTALNKEALLFSDENVNKANTLAGSWVEGKTKSVSAGLKPGCIGIVNVKCRNAGGPTDKSLYNQWRNNVCKKYNVEFQMVQISTQGDKTSSDFIPVEKYTTPVEFSILSNTVKCALKIRVTSIESKQVFFESQSWGMIDSVQEKTQYEMFFELSPGDIEMLLKR